MIHPTEEQINTAARFVIMGEGYCPEDKVTDPVYLDTATNIAYALLNPEVRFEDFTARFNEWYDAECDRLNADWTEESYTVKDYLEGK